MPRTVDLTLRCQVKGLPPAWRVATRPDTADGGQRAAGDVGQRGHDDHRRADLGQGSLILRYYQRIGLLPEPERPSSGYRLYDEADAERIQFIRRAQRVGLALGEVTEIMAFRERGERPCDYVAELIESRLRELSDRLQHRGTENVEAPYCHSIATSPGDASTSRPRPDGPR